MTNRRSFIKQAAIGSVAISAVGSPSIAASASRLSKPLTVWESKGFTPEKLGKWPSDVDQHLALYEGYVKKANELFELIQKADRDPAKQSITYSELRALKVEYSFAIGGVKNHEIYFGHLRAEPREDNAPTARIKEAIELNFGSVAAWEADLRATGISARGWAWLAWDRDRHTLFNYIGDAQNSFPVWNAVPLVALDMYEHAFFKDYGKNRNAYISDFLKRIDWHSVGKAFAEAIG